MDDQQIVKLLWARDERGLQKLQQRYTAYCESIARRIVVSEQDVEECVNDTWYKVWVAIPPHRPERLSVFVGKIVRRLAINRERELSREKRGGGQYVLALDELSDCIADGDGDSDSTDAMVLRDALNAFVAALPTTARRLFLQRYWYLCPIAEIASSNGMRESAVKMSLARTREKLKQYLTKEGITI